MRRRTALAMGAATLVLSAGLAPAAQAKSPHQVDPASVTPALNPNFAPWSCFEAGVGITCQGESEERYHEPAGLSCAGREVWINGSAHQRMTRWHTAGGLATRTTVHLDVPGDVFSLTADGSGPSLTISGHWNRHYVYAVAGDLASRTLTEVGAIYLSQQPGRGIVLHDTGSVTFEPGADFEEIAVMHGVHDVYSDPTAVDRAICTALTEVGG